MEYISGYCGIGSCEGTSPTSFTGKPMKVCVAYDICTCSCHKKFDSMYQKIHEPRVGHQNPNYEPAPPIDLTWMDEPNAGPVQVITAPPKVEYADKPSELTPGLLESAREFEPTYDGYRRRGQLEAEVQRVCNRAMLGEFDENCTAKFVAEQIDPDNPPSTGAIGAVFKRWESYGYAVINKHPVYFKRLTIEGMRDGLEVCKKRSGK